MQPEIAIDKRQTTIFVNRSIYWIALLLFSLSVLLVYIQADEGLNHNTRATIPDMVYGRAAKPFVTRMLLPALARITEPSLPPGIVRVVQQNESLRLTIYYLSQYGPPALGFAVLIWMYVALIAFLAGLRYLMSGLGFSSGWIGAAPFVIQPVMLILFMSYGYIYDLAILALFTWSLAFMQRGHYSAYLITLALAILAKETALLLVWVYVLVNLGSLNWERFIEQTGVFMVGRSLLLIAYANNPGASFIEIHVLDWLKEVADKPALVISGLLTMFVIAFAAGWRWSLKPQFLRRACLGTFPALFVLYLIGGNPGEIRVFLEAFPIAFLMMIWPYYAKNGGESYDSLRG